MDIDAFWQLIADSLEHAPGRAARDAAEEPAVAMKIPGLAASHPACAAVSTA